MADSLDEILSSQPTVTDEEEDEQARSDEDEVVGAEVPRSVRALQLLSEAAISLSELLDDVVLGDSIARGDRKVMAARSGIYSSGVLPRILDRIRRPSDMQIRRAKHETAVAHIKKWANETTIYALRYELAKHAKSAKAANVETDVVSDEALKELTFDAVSEEVQLNAPKLFETLSKICTVPRHSENTQKDSKFAVTLLVNALAYQLSHKSNRMQKLICIYLKAKGVPKSCFNFVQKAGLSLGYDWSRTALEKISAATMAEAIAAFEDHLCIAMHGNI